MKILHIPHNIASQLSITVRALRDVGVEARGIYRRQSHMLDHSGVEAYELTQPGPHILKYVRDRLTYLARLRSAIQWADAVHWHWGRPRGHLDRLIRRCVVSTNKARLVEFWGSDVRIPRIATADNPYLEQVYRKHPELARGARDQSIRVQRAFARQGFAFLLPGFELRQYMQVPNPAGVYFTRQRVLPDEFEYHPPRPDNTRPLVVHAPSKMALKGTHWVHAAIDRLRGRHSFEFRLLSGVPHPQALHVLQSADVVLDQFVFGEHGILSIEAMALGKPVLCYLRPWVAKRLPSDCPIVNANPDNLTEILGGLLRDGRRRHELGVRGRAYVEKYHDAHKIARELVGIYEDLLRKRRRTGRERR